MAGAAPYFVFVKVKEAVLTKLVLDCFSRTGQMHKNSPLLFLYRLREILWMLIRALPAASQCFIEVYAGA